MRLATRNERNAKIREDIAFRRGKERHGDEPNRLDLSLLRAVFSQGEGDSDDLQGMSYRADPSSDRHTSSGVRGSRGCLYPGSVAGSFWIEVAVPGTPSVVAPTAVRPVAMIGLQKRDVHRGVFQCSYNDRGMVVLSRPRRCGFDQPGTAAVLIYAVR